MCRATTYAVISRTQPIPYVPLQIRATSFGRCFKNQASSLQSLCSPKREEGLPRTGLSISSSSSKKRALCVWSFYCAFASFVLRYSLLASTRIVPCRWSPPIQILLYSPGISNIIEQHQPHRHTIRRGWP